MNEYACAPGAEPGTFILSITFPRVLMVNDGVRTYPCTGIRGFYRARMRGYSPDEAMKRLTFLGPPPPWPFPWQGVIIDDTDHMLAAIRDLEAMIVETKEDE